MSKSTKASVQEVAIAGVYAQALLSLAESRSQSDDVLDELESLGGQIERDPFFAESSAMATVTMGLIFRDGFESGDTAAWQ